MRPSFFVSLLFLFLLISSSLLLIYLIKLKPTHILDSLVYPEDAPSSELLELNDRIWNQLNYKSKPKQSPVIIFKSSNIDREIPLGYRYFHESGCRVSNCFITVNESKFSTADVLYLSPEDFDMRPSPKSSQITVLRLLESPENTQKLKFLNGKINFTASYRWDADFVIPYGKVIKGPSKKQIYIPKKKKLGAWFVSNCVTINDRMGIVKELRKYVEIDIYGSCTNRAITQRQAESFLRNDYQFYFAFENSNCRDYVTEKFFQALRFGAIPIVFGASLEFYQKIAPKDSFVHISQFPSIKELARFLKLVASTQELLEKFHAWRTEYSFVDTRFYCRLCALMQNPHEKVYEDLSEWFSAEHDCVRSNFSTFWS
ncbi:unnamed protein product, partial [Mesorhabditis belari]|uniref:Fucosyltransferase n=1 Tax=Mesorhabditis belari TaxID=2138241 RepID=A0AAF3EHB3_9BILA